MALPDAAELELPSDWLTRQLDPTVPLDDDLLADFDPFLGLVACGDGVLREGGDAVWSERSMVGPGVPLDDGLLGVRVTIEEESDTESGADAAALGSCQASNSEVLLERSAITIDVDGNPVEGQRLRVSSAPTADVPFPSTFAYLVAHDGDATATVLMYGLDLGQDWSSRTEEVVARILERAA